MGYTRAGTAREQLFSTPHCSEAVRVPQDPPSATTMSLGLDTIPQQSKQGCGKGERNQEWSSPRPGRRFERSKGTGNTLGKCLETNPPGLSHPPLWGSPWCHSAHQPHQHWGSFFESCSLYITLHILAIPPLLLCIGVLGNCHGTTHIPPSPDHGPAHCAPHKHDPSPDQAGPRQPPAQSFIEVFAQKKHQGHSIRQRHHSRQPPARSAAGGVSLVSLSCSRSCPAGATAGHARGAQTA